MSEPSAVFFDLDGTLIDTENLYAEAGRELVLNSGGSWGQEDNEAAIGTALDDFAVQLQDLGVEGEVDKLISLVVSRVNDMIGSRDVWREGAIDLLYSLSNSGMPIGLVTMSYRETVDQVFSQVVLPDFQVEITGDVVTRGKPDPEPYQLAAQKMGFDPASCVVLEDSVLGLTSARRAGMRTIAVSPLSDEYRHLFDVEWLTLTGRNAEELVEAFSQFPVLEKSC